MRSGTASTTWSGPRSTGIRCWLETWVRVQELLREIVESGDDDLRGVNRDHVHVLIEIPPHLSVSKAAQYQKGEEFAPDVVDNFKAV